MEVKNSIILPLTYLGPIQAYCRYYGSKKIIIEQFDNYQKQSYRNRCNIYAANGKLSLVIPVIHEKTGKTLVKDIRIDYASNWKRVHWGSLVSAYCTSPFFEYYRDQIEPVYQEKFIFLIDLCLRFDEEIRKILCIDLNPELSSQYLSHGEISDAEDYREIIHPKKSYSTDTNFRVIEYSQVFNEKHGFLPNLSALDLIFNTGPEASIILKSSLLRENSIEK